jgi:2,3-bisphosphoglycerate-dependent phosphoglycerate mutase
VRPRRRSRDSPEITKRELISTTIRCLRRRQAFARQSLRFDARYTGVDPTWLPAAESLKDTLSRVLPYRESRIVPELRANKTVLIVAHGNSLRALVKMLDMMSESDIVEFNIPTGIPMLYELDEQLQPVSRRFLGDPGAVAAAQEAVRRQAEKK